MMEFKAVKSADPDVLTRVVNIWLDDGWEVFSASAGGSQQVSPAWVFLTKEV